MLLSEFLKEWNNPSPFIEVLTSGSTGKPQRLQVEKRSMRASAKLTCDFLDLHGKSALLCMDLKYIGAKMMVVRSIVGKMSLITTPPTGHPLANLQEIPYFAAMVPLQVYNSLQHEVERERLKNIATLIIGGGPIHPSLAEALQDFPHPIYSTYGMTETLSHIALRRINGKEASTWYTPFKGIEVKTNKEGCLVIDAPMLLPQPITTCDVAEVDSSTQRFRILGRKDNVVNSGGIKIRLEEIESRLSPYLNFPFCCSKQKDAKFGECLVLLSESNDFERIKACCQQALPKYHIPKYFYHIHPLPLTETGKPKRKEIAEWIKSAPIDNKTGIDAFKE